MFDKMITTTIIKVLWIVGVVFFGIMGIVGMVAGGQQHALLALLALAVAILVQLIWRMVCEWIILFWKMHELLADIKKNTSNITHIEAEKI